MRGWFQPADVARIKRYDPEGDRWLEVATVSVHVIRQENIVYIAGHPDVRLGDSMTVAGYDDVGGEVVTVTPAPPPQNWTQVSLRPVRARPSP